MGRWLLVAVAVDDYGGMVREGKFVQVRLVIRMRGSNGSVKDITLTIGVDFIGRSQTRF